MCIRDSRDAVPAARVIYIEPDVWIDPNEKHPPTDTIILKGLELSLIHISEPTRLNGESRIP